MRDTVSVLPPVNVTGTHSVAPNRETATHVRVDRAAANRFLPLNVADALATVPGVEVIKTGAWSSRISLRGLYGDRVLFLVDGVRMNALRGHGTQFSLVSLDQVQSVEVMPGAASAQFGTGALAGVVNVITHRSLFEDTPRGSIALGARGSEPGSYYSQTGWLRLLSPRAGFEFSGGLSQLDYLHTPQGRIANSGDHEDSYTARGGFRIGRADIDVEHTHHAAHDVGLPGVTGGAVIAGSYPLQGRDAQRIELVVKGNGALPDFRLLGVHQILRVHYSETSVESIFVRGRLVATRTRDARDRVRMRLAGIQPSVQFEGPVPVKLFGEYRHETAVGPLFESYVNRDINGNVVASSSSQGMNVAPSRRDAWGAGTSVSRMQWQTRFEANLRYDEIATEADSNITRQTPAKEVHSSRGSADFGASHAFGWIEPYGHVATGFRAPNLDELYYDGVIHGGLRLFGNSELASERSRSYEIGVRAAEGSIDWVRRARASVYRHDVDDFIAFKYIGQLYLVPRFQFFNVRQARIDGAEATVVLRSNGYEVAVNGSTLKTTDRDTGKRLDDSGVPSASIEFVVPARPILPLGAVSMRASWFDAVKDVNASLLQPAFWTCSVQADAVVGGIRAVMAVRNVFDNLYRYPQSFTHESGRTFAFSLYRDFSARWTR